MSKLVMNSISPKFLKDLEKSTGSKEPFSKMSRRDIIILLAETVYHRDEVRKRHLRDMALLAYKNAAEFKEWQDLYKKDNLKIKGDKKK